MNTNPVARRSFLAGAGAAVVAAAIPKGTAQGQLQNDYELPISVDYVKHWGVLEAIREIIQNALDSESPFEWEFKEDKLFVRSRHARLEPKTLLLGTTSKADNADAIGSFGEGYKIAMLVLVRDGYSVIIHNRENDWTPYFKDSRKYGSKILCVRETTATRHNEGVTFEVGGLSSEDIDPIKNSCLAMQIHIGEVKETSIGRILMERPGKLYVGGLYICDTQLQYGYDIRPSKIQLERDRQTVSSYDLQRHTMMMWFETEDFDVIAELMENQCRDLAHAEYGSPPLVKEACYRRFKEQHPGAVAARSQQEVDRLAEQGMTNTVFIDGGGYYQAVTQAPQYRSGIPAKVDPITIEQMLAEWLRKQKKYMRRPAIVSFKVMLKAAKTWRII